MVYAGAGRPVPLPPDCRGESPPRSGEDEGGFEFRDREGGGGGEKLRLLGWLGYRRGGRGRGGIEEEERVRIGGDGERGGCECEKSVRRGAEGERRS